MATKLPTLIFAATSIVLALLLYGAKQDIADLRAALESATTDNPEPAWKAAEAEARGALGEKDDAYSTEPERAQDHPSAMDDRQKQAAARRIMRDMARTIDENPTINKMVEASQRGAVGALYADMMEYLNLDAEETAYFMDLLMYRQMAHVDMHMKMASGTLSEEERLALQEKTRSANETTRSEMENFLNNADDFEEFRFYEETIGERMMLSQMDQMLGEPPLPDETYREVLEIMYEERENYGWSTDLHDNENTDMNPARFSEENITKHMADMTAVGARMDERMQTILTPEQLEAWRESGAAMQALISGQLIQANQAFGKE